MHEKAQFMALPKTVLITNKYGKTPTLPDNFQFKSPPPAKHFLCARQSPFMALRKLGFIVVPDVYKLRLAKHVLSKFPISNFNELF